MKTLWILEDHSSLRNTLKKVFSQDPEVRCTQAFGNAEAMWHTLTTEPAPDILLIDLGLPGAGGLEVIPQCRARFPAMLVIVLTVSEDDDKIFRAVCSGASGYLLKGSSLEEVVRTVREALHGGAPMTASIARRVLEMFASLAPQPPDYGLTPREKEILQLLVIGKTTKEIAAALELSIHTVDTHLRRIYAKLEVNNRSGAVAKALRGRLT